MGRTITRQDAIALIDALPSESLPELVQFAEFLRFKSSTYAMLAPKAEEQRLLEIIQRRLPSEQQRRLNGLRQKSEQGELASEEYAELLQLIDQVEQADAERAQALIELAHLHNKPISTIFHENSPEYVTNAA